MRRYTLPVVFLLCCTGCVVNPVPTPFDQDKETASKTSDDSPNNGGAADPATRGPQTPGSGGVDEASDGDSAFAGAVRVAGQQIGLFRDILQAGEVPAPGTVDELGFFADHKLEQAAPDCGETLCAHASMASAANYMTGSDVTLLKISLNSPVVAAELQRPPLHAVLALDRSQSMAGASLDHCKLGITLMLARLQAGDRVSVVAFSDQAEVLIEAAAVQAPGGQQAILDALGGLQAAGKSNLYDGLFSAFALAQAHAKPGAEARVVLLSDGPASAGLLNPGKLVSLAAAWAAKGVSVSTIGLGEAADLPTLRDLAEAGDGRFYYFAKPAALEDVFVEEAGRFQVPLALELAVEVQIGPGWRVGETYGSHSWVGHGHGGRFGLPLFSVAGRSDDSDPMDLAAGTGHRGGGEALLLQLTPVNGVSAPGEPLADLTLRWRDPGTGSLRTQALQVAKGWTGPQAPQQGFFAGAGAPKAFVMLNLFKGFKMAAGLAEDADPGTARAVLLALRAGVSQWQSDPARAAPDADIAEDLKMLDMFVANLKQLSHQTPAGSPPEPWPQP